MVKMGMSISINPYSSKVFFCSFKLEVESENINTESGKICEVSILHILNIDIKRKGTYVCHAKNNTALDMRSITLNVLLPAKIVKISKPIYTKRMHNITLFCLVEGYPIEGIKWYKDNEVLNSNLWTVDSINETLKNTSLKINEVTKDDNATYTCLAVTGYYSTNSSTAILVLDKPHITIDFIKAIGTNKIYLNWTVNDGNDKDNLHYTIQYKSTKDWFYYQEKIKGNQRSIVLKDMLNNDTEYTVKIMATNSQGDSHYSTSHPVKLLRENPVFVPEIKLNGLTFNSITIAWSTPMDNVKDHVHYYQLYLKTANNSALEAIHPASDGNIYMFSDLAPATDYYAQVAACSEYSQECGPKSAVINCTTMDATSGPPSNPSIQCKFDEVSQVSFILVTWEAPSDPRGTIISYNVCFVFNCQI